MNIIAHCVGTSHAVDNMFVPLKLDENLLLIHLGKILINVLRTVALSKRVNMI